MESEGTSGKKSQNPDNREQKFVNKAGAVRPKMYRSKYNVKKQRIETADDLLVLPNKESKKDSVVGHRELKTNIDAHILNEQFPDSSGNKYTDSSIVNDCEQVDVSENFSYQTQGEIVEDESTQVRSDADELEEIEADFIGFIKQKEEISIADLLCDLNMERNKSEDNTEDDEFDEDDEKDEKDGDVSEESKIYPGHFLSVKNSILLIWLFSITHSLTACQMSDLLTLISLHMMSSYPAMKSFYRFKRYFKNMSSPFKKHFYCSFCYTLIPENLDICPNKHCRKNLIPSSSKEYFLELPVKSQLSGLFSRQSFREGLKYRSERVKKHQNNIEDVFDGLQYKLLSDNDGPLSSNKTCNISFTFHTDGIPVFKSSKTSMWPIFLMINELPYRMRKSRDNMILSGLWFGQNKPVMNLFCEPLHKSLFELERGLSVNLQDQKNTTIHVHGYLFCMTCDTPARSIVLNMNQHNGQYCCPKCLQPGDNYRTATGGNVRIFPFQTDDPTGPQRSSEQLKKDAQEAIDSGTSKNGVKGPSFAMFCPSFDPVRNIGIDYMHLIFLGSVRLLLNLWFNVSHSLQSFSLYKHVHVVDSRLTNIKPSHFITRIPRSISDHLKFWKAAELRSWFFYYSIPCIMDLMQPRHLYHFCAFVEAVFLLNQSSISENDIQNSERLLKYFVFMMPGLYGERYMTINIHSLLHLPQMVRELGPLWAVSCFPFESASGDLLKLFHGTQYIDIQIINAVHVFHSLPSLSQHVPETSLAYPLIKSLMKISTRNLTNFQIYGGSYEKKVGKPVEALLSGFFMKPVESQDVLFFKRAFIRGVMYHSSDYTRAYSRNSYTVKFIYNESMKFGIIKWFGKLKDEEKSPFACISVLRCKNVDIFRLNHEHLEPDEHIKSNFMHLQFKHINFVEYTHEICIVSIHNIADLCICIECDNCLVVCEEPNHNEINL